MRIVLLAHQVQRVLGLYARQQLRPHVVAEALYKGVEDEDAIAILRPRQRSDTYRTCSLALSMAHGGRVSNAALPSMVFRKVWRSMGGR